MKKAIFARSHRMLGAASQEYQAAPSRMNVKPKGESHPPQKSSAEIDETRIMFAYSARKNTAKVMPEYSTWKPATISLSPSEPSNGARFVSPSPAMKGTTNIGSSGSQNHSMKPYGPSWRRTVSVRLILWP